MWGVYFALSGKVYYIKVIREYRVYYFKLLTHFQPLENFNCFAVYNNCRNSMVKGISSLFFFAFVEWFSVEQGILMCCTILLLHSWLVLGVCFMCTCKVWACVDLFISSFFLLPKNFFSDWLLVFLWHNLLYV